MIGVKPVKQFLDDRGKLFEMARIQEEGIDAKQVTVSTIFPNAIKAFHKHDIQTDWVVCVKGNVKLITFELDAQKKVTHLQKTFFGEDNPQLVTILPGTYHGYCSIGNREAVLIYITNQIYNPSDELRLSWNFLGKEVWEIECK